MYGMDIGQSQLEEINIIVPGANYGWGEREGTFVNGQAVSGDRSEVFPVTNPDARFIEPVAQYDHDEGAAIAGGFAYSGTLVPELEGKFVFGDIVDGRLFYCEVADLLDGDPTTQATIFELQLVVNGSTTNMQSIIGGGRVDLRLGQDTSGEIVILTKEDGGLRQFVTLTDPMEPMEPVDPPEDSGGWTLVDNFQCLAVGDLVEGTTNHGAIWTGDGSATHTVEVDPSDASNLAMRVSGAPGSAVLRAQFSDASTNIAPGATGTLYYRFRTPVASDGTTDHVLGLTDNNSITNFNFKSGLRNTIPSGVNNLDLRDAGTYESVATLQDNTWYNFWMVTTNTNPGTFECYMQSDDDPNFASQTLLALNDPFDYRINGNTAIVNVYFRNANNAGGTEGNDLFFDDVHINSSMADLSIPDPLILGDINLDGAVTFTDIQPFITVLSDNGFQTEADCDKNGEVDFFDIQPFIAILAGQ